MCRSAARLQACSGLSHGCVIGFTGLIQILSEEHGAWRSNGRLFFFFFSFLGSVLFSGQRFIPSLVQLSRNCIVCTERLDSDL